MLDNAVRFTKAGGVALIVEEKSGPTAQDTLVIRFSCVDTGRGIPEDKLRVLFREFSQVDMRFSREVRL